MSASVPGHDAMRKDFHDAMAGIHPDSFELT